MTILTSNVERCSTIIVLNIWIGIGCSRVNLTDFCHGYTHKPSISAVRPISSAASGAGVDTQQKFEKYLDRCPLQNQEEMISNEKSDDSLCVITVSATTSRLTPTLRANKDCSLASVMRESASDSGALKVTMTDPRTIFR